MQVLAAHNILAGEDLTFFYPSTEWDMDQPFDCFCGAENCLGRIEGAKVLTPEQASRYRLSKHINEKLAAKFKQN